MAGIPSIIDLAGVTSDTLSFRLDGAAAFDDSGRSVASAGDVNGDGYGDLIVGAPGASPSGRNDAGSSYVVFGKASGWADLDLGNLGSAGFRLDGAAGSDLSGYSVASAGDVNGDGYGDLVVGAYFADPSGRSSAGSSYVILGKASGFTNLDLGNLGSGGFRLDGAAPVDFRGDLSGYSVASAGDVNGDGFGDIIVGAYLADPSGRGDAGSSYVVFGKASGFTDLDLGNLGDAGFRLDGATPVDFRGDHSGFSVASAGDVNGDGYGDLVVGAPGADPSGRGDAGSSYVILGKASGFTNLDLGNLGSAGFRLDGAVAGDASGFSVASAGDLNGDGYGDIVVGAYTADPSGRAGAGSSYVVFGKASGFTDLDLGNLGPAGFRIGGAGAGDVSGISVASAGDVNGDGYADLIVGATGANPSGRAGAGSSYVVLGKASGFTDLDLGNLGDAGFRLDGAAEDDRSGRSVASAGDLDGDGYDDLVVGAPGADPSGRAGAGSSYVVFGEATAPVARTASGPNLSAFGGDFDDTLTGSAGTDRLVGRGGDDLLLAAADGPDTLDGGAGTDTASFADAAAGVVAVLTTGTVSGGGTLLGIENVTGSAHADVLRGDAGANALVGGDGVDNLLGGAGADTLDGGDGLDIVTYRGSAAVSLDLLGGPGEGGDAEGDVLLGIERLTGTAFGDTLRGSDAADRLDGFHGNDLLAGRAGNDALLGGLGDDTLRGGADRDLLQGGGGADRLEGGAGGDRLTGNGGADLFVWTDAADSVRGDRDAVLDFSRAGGDRLDVAAFDAAFVGSGPFLGGGVASVGWHTAGTTGVEVRLDADGNGTADLVILVAGVARLVEADFVL